MDPSHVRIVAIVLALFTSAPVLLGYAAMAVVVPNGPAAPRLGDADLSWQADGVRITWTAPIAPHAVSWLHWLGAIAGIALATAAGIAMIFLLLFASAMYLGLGPDALWPVTVLLTGLTVVWPLLPLTALGGLLPRPWTMTCTHAALFVERPLRKPRRIDLAALAHIEGGPHGIDLRLRDGEVITLPAPRDLATLPDFVAQVKQSRRRAIAHHQDLSGAAAPRRQLEALMARRRREGS